MMRGFGFGGFHQRVLKNGLLFTSSSLSMMSLVEWEYGGWPDFLVLVIGKNGRYLMLVDQSLSSRNIST